MWANGLVIQVLLRKHGLEVPLTIKWFQLIFQNHQNQNNKKLQHHLKILFYNLKIMQVNGQDILDQLKKHGSEVLLTTKWSQLTFLSHQKHQRQHPFFNSKIILENGLDIPDQLRKHGLEEPPITPWSQPISPSHQSQPKNLFSRWKAQEIP